MKSLAFMYECRSLSLKSWSGLLSDVREPWQWPTSESNMCVWKGPLAVWLAIFLHQKYPALNFSPKACSSLYISTSAIHSFESNIPHAKRVFLKYRNLKEAINEILKTVLRIQSAFLLPRVRKERRANWMELIGALGGLGEVFERKNRTQERKEQIKTSSTLSCPVVFVLNCREKTLISAHMHKCVWVCVGG